MGDRAPLIVAIDTADGARAASLAEAVAPHCGMVKLGLEYFSAQGPAGLAGFPRPIFLDLKLHDIPATVAGAVRALLPTRASLITLHAAGGAAMIEAARNAAEAGCSATLPRPLLLAVTLLTSLDAASLPTIGVAASPAAQVLALARLALAAGADGLVCSGQEVASLRAAFGPAPLLVVPGIRPPGAPIGDQARITTPRAAMAAGASHIVVGRPITAAADPAAAAAAILAELG